MIHQPGRAAWTKPAPWGPAPDARVPPIDVATEPITAIPNDDPAWRLVDAIAAATPAWDVGIPDTAVLVIGGLISPKPKPNGTYASSTQEIGVLASKPDSRPAPIAMPSPPSSRGSRGP